MTPESVIGVTRQALDLAIIIGALPLLSALVVGLVVGMVQAATQINEMTLSFIPKLLVLALSFSLAGRWMLTELVDFTRELFQNIPLMIS